MHKVPGRKQQRICVCTPFVQDNFRHIHPIAPLPLETKMKPFCLNIWVHSPMSHPSERTHNLNKAGRLRKQLVTVSGGAMYTHYEQEYSDTLHINLNNQSSCFSSETKNTGREKPFDRRAGCNKPDVMAGLRALVGVEEMCEVSLDVEGDRLSLDPA
eukprot:Blabericola_migrator_1__11955@NODE_731_length_6696_cov_64_725298_g527_i0_p6_GENE_NODE_731_length_6696_cov_64_725298_g527_i0NODE_731_length_6696_cov_64_725298_g527_i0_p6_ORF_typecomplete_len157_score12_66_NODE_731_length_6696_cov_64_725298_g527_i014751945